ncbi:hypothetical protein ABT068_29280, partial [Streptomyces sp. NPDC002215]
IVGVIKTINELKNLLLGILAKAASAIMKIIKDPIGFLGNLVKAVGAGLQLFITNIAEHLKTGVVSWLLGTAVKAGLELPQKFDLKGIIQLIASLLGLTWDNIRARITRKGIPDQAMTAVESSVPVAKKLATEGPAGAVKEIESEAGDLKATILEKLTSYLIPTVIIAGITWIISLLNPASAFVRAVKGIIDIVTFIVNQGAQIVEFVNAVLDAVIAIANGGSAGVPKMVEAALAASVPLLIGFLASLLGIGSLANKVKSVFHAVARPVNRAIDKIVGFIAKAGKKIWGKLNRDKKGDGGPQGEDSRSKADKEGDLKKAISAAEKLLKKREAASKVSAKLSGIKARFRLTELRLVVDEKRKGEQLSHVEGKVNPEGRTGKEVLPLDEIHEAIARNDGKLGTLIGQGGFGSVHEVPGMPHIVIKTAIGGGENPQLDKEADSLALLDSRGVPTPYRGKVKWTDPAGRTHSGIVMDRVSGAFSKAVLQMGKFADLAVDSEARSLVTAATVTDLLKLKETCLAHGLDIQDLQFMIQQDGTIRVIDPARIQDVSGLPGKKARPIMQAFTRRIDSIISRVRSIAGGG